MFNMKKLLIVSAIATGSFLGGCSKNDNDGGNGPSEKTQLITSAAWKYDDAKVDITGDEVGDTGLPPGILQDCDKDNVITLKLDSTGTIDEGNTKCDAGDPQSVDITWEFKNNETVINIPQNIFGNLSGDAKIKTLTATKLTLVKQVQITDPAPATVNVILDLKH
jgi:hypothetical protein